MPTPTFLKLFSSQNRSHSTTIFLKGVALDRTRKALAVYDLLFSEVLKTGNS
jgi:hypothetical protein